MNCQHQSSQSAKMHIARALFIGFASLLIGIIVSGAGQLQAQEPAVVLLEPQLLALDKGQRSSIAIRVEGADNVYGVQIDLSYDASKIKVLDQDETKPGVQIAAGDFLTLNGGFEAANEADNAAGRLFYAHSLLAPAPPASGSGTLAILEVEALTAGSPGLQLAKVILASPDGDQLPVQLGAAAENESIIIVPTAMSVDSTAPAAPANQDESDSAAAAVEESAPTESPAQTEPEITPPRPTPIVESTRTAVEADTAVPAAAAGVPASTIQPTTDGEEAVESVAEMSTAVPTTTAPAAEIAQAPITIEQDSQQTAAEQSPPAVTVIGQRQIVTENQEQPSEPAPTAGGEGRIDGLLSAAGLVLLVMALIAFWFLRRWRAEKG